MILIFDIKEFLTSGSLGHNALMITEDDEVLACGSNECGCLGLGHASSSLKVTPSSVAELKKKGVKGDFDPLRICNFRIEKHG